jgi:hypothetical protein
VRVLVIEDDGPLADVLARGRRAGRVRSNAIDVHVGFRLAGRPGVPCT